MLVGVESAEARLRPTAATPDFDFVVLIEGIGVAQLEAVTPDAVDTATKASSGPCEAGVYRLAYLLGAAG